MQAGKISVRWNEEIGKAADLGLIRSERVDAHRERHFSSAKDVQWRMMKVVLGEYVEPVSNKKHRPFSTKMSDPWLAST